MAVAEEVQVKVTNIYNLVHENVFNEQTDEGYLEIEQHLYEKEHAWVLKDLEMHRPPGSPLGRRWESHARLIWDEIRALKERRNGIKTGEDVHAILLIIFKLV